MLEFFIFDLKKWIYYWVKIKVTQIVNPIDSAEDLIKQTEIQYGSVDGGSTKEFFRNSKVPTYSRMWSFMVSWGNQVFVKDNQQGVQKVLNSKGKYAFLLESSVNEYLNERKHTVRETKIFKF